MLVEEHGLETIMCESVFFFFFSGVAFTVIYHGDRSRSAQMSSAI